MLFRSSGFSPTGRLRAPISLLNPLNMAMTVPGYMAEKYNEAATRSAMGDVLKTIERGKLSRSALQPENRAIRNIVPAVLPPANFTGNVEFDERTQRASGGKIPKRDYPAKRLTLAAKRAHKEIADEFRPLMDMPDEHIAEALHRARDK